MPRSRAEPASRRKSPRHAERAGALRLLALPLVSVAVVMAGVLVLFGLLVDDGCLGGVRLKPTFGDSAQTMRRRDR